MPVIILTKSDLVEDPDELVREVEEIAVGVDIHVISAKSGYGLDELSKYMQPGKTMVFLGSSGVGKSSLVNAIAGEELMSVKEIREDDSKGRHTTSYRQLIMMKNGAMIIDTPGMREIGVWDVSEGLEETFSDVTQYFGECRFSDCRHDKEPGCAIKKALREGLLQEDRWNSYKKLAKEARFSSKEEALKSKEEFFKAIAKKYRHKK
jgi:ribosome biogenesis GTPase